MATLNQKIQGNYPGLDEQATFNTAVYDLLVELHAWAETLAAKLNADGGVTDTNYDATITAANPSDPDA